MFDSVYAVYRCSELLIFQRQNISQEKNLEKTRDKGLSSFDLVKMFNVSAT